MKNKKDNKITLKLTPEELELIKLALRDKADAYLKVIESEQYARILSELIGGKT